LGRKLLSTVDAIRQARVTTIDFIGIFAESRQAKRRRRGVNWSAEKFIASSRRRKAADFLILNS
jgi:hypothetical protein